MKKSNIIEGIHQMKFEEIYGRYRQKSLNCEEAAELLGVSVRTFLRKRERYDSEDFDGRFDLRLGRVSAQRASETEVREVRRLYKERYREFNVKHFHEFLKEKHKIKRSYTWTKNKLEESGLVKRGKKGGDHRLRRERRPMAGMMIHQDGSTHRWIPEREGNLDLIITLDDATSEITSGFLVEQEGTESSFSGIKETIERYGLFCSLYTDRGSHYFHTPEAGGKVDRRNLTQVGRALKQLGIKHIAAYSPQARGRSERLFGTLQERLPKEFALNKIRTIEEANEYLKREYIPRHNKTFGVEAREEKRAYIPYILKDLHNILCIQEERTVQHDNTIRVGGLVLQIPSNEMRHHYVKTTVMVHRYEDGSLGVYYGHLCIGEYEATGKLKEKEKEREAA